MVPLSCRSNLAGRYLEDAEVFSDVDRVVSLNSVVPELE
jgi:hypothetical protein